VLQRVYPVDAAGQLLDWNRLITDPIRLEAIGTGLHPPASVTAVTTSTMSSRAGQHGPAAGHRRRRVPHVFQGQGPLTPFVTALSPGTAAALTNEDVDYPVAADFITTLGKASRGIASQTGDQTARKPPASKELFRSAGYEDVHVAVTGWPGVVWDLFATSQAEVFLYLGHGWHDANVMMLNGTYDSQIADDRLSPADIGSAWTHGLTTAIFYGCTVLDIGDPNNWAAATGYSATSSPGRAWAAVPGPTLYLGFEGKAPSLTLDEDNQDEHGRDIVHQLAVLQAASPDWVESYRQATDSLRLAHGAAIVDTANQKYYYWSEHQFLPQRWWWWETRNLSEMGT